MTDSSDVDVTPVRPGRYARLLSQPALSTRTMFGRAELGKLFGVSLQQLVSLINAI